MHDADRLVGIGHDQRRDLRGIEDFECLAGENVAEWRIARVHVRRLVNALVYQAIVE